MDQRTFRHRWGERVARGRRAASLSQADLARRCGVTQQTISDIERGNAAPGERLKLRIAGALGLVPEELFPSTDVALDIGLGASEVA
jgi:transcriptional regulator with XRE-family HTH domain